MDAYEKNTPSIHMQVLISAMKAYAKRRSCVCLFLVGCSEGKEHIHMHLLTVWIFVQAENCAIAIGMNHINFTIKSNILEPKS